MCVLRVRFNREFLGWLKINDARAVGRAVSPLRVWGAFAALALRCANLATVDEEMDRQLQIWLRLANGAESLSDVLYEHYMPRLACSWLVDV